MRNLIQHEISLDLASGARLSLLYFSDRELRWIFTCHYVGAKRPGEPPDVVNKIRLVANCANGLLESQIVLSMHVVILNRRSQKFFADMDISPGAKTYLEFSYERSAAEYKLTEICKGARERLRLDSAEPAIVKPVAFPFPVPDRVPVELGKAPGALPHERRYHYPLRSARENAAMRLFKGTPGDRRSTP